MISRRLIVLVLLSAWLGVSDGAAQVEEYRVSVTRLGNAEGLNSGVVSTIFEDSRGIVWVGTGAGLYRWDGRRFLPVRITDIERPMAVESLLEDHGGEIWVGGEWGLGRVNDDLESLTRWVCEGCQVSEELSNVRGLDEGEDGSLWAVGSRIVALTPERSLRHSIPVPRRRGALLTSVLVRSSSEVYVGITIPPSGETTGWSLSSDSIMVASASEDSSGSTKVRLIHSAFNMTWLDDGSVAIALGRSGLVRSGAGNDNFQPVPLDRSFFHFRNVHQKSPDELIVAAASLEEAGNAQWGLYEVSLTDGKVGQYIGPSGTIESLTELNPLAIEMDRFGSLWVGTDAVGLVRFNPSSATSKWFEPNSLPGRQNSQFVRAVVQDEDKNIWMGTPSGLRVFSSLDASSELAVSVDQDWDNPYINSLSRPFQGSVWVGVRGGKLFRASIAEGRITIEYHSSPCPRGVVSSISEPREDGVWFACAIGLVGWADLDTKGQSRTFSLAPPLDSPYLRLNHIRRTDDGRLLVSSNMGLIEVKMPDPSASRFPAEIQASNHLPSHRIRNIAPTEDGWWVATGQNGLIKLTHGLEIEKTYRPDNSEFPVSDVISVSMAPSGDVWASTTNGVIRFDPEEDRSEFVDRMSVQVNAEFNFNAYFAGANGQIFFGATMGLLQVDTDQWEPLPEAPVVFPLGWSSETSTDRIEHPPAQSASLPADTKRLEFHFGLAHSSYSGVGQLTYTLSPYDSEWLVLDEGATTVTYTNLPPGEYDLRVRGRMNRGTWSPDMEVMKLSIERPWWMHPFSLLGGLLVVLGSFYGVYRWRTASLVERKRQLERAVEEKTEQLKTALEKIHGQALELKTIDNAKSLYFDHLSREIRNPLTVTKLQIQKALASSTKEPAAAEQLSKALQSNEKTSNHLNRLLDLARMDSGQMSIYPESFSLADCLKEILTPEVERATDAGIHFEWDIPDGDQLVVADMKMTLAAISIFVHEAIRHSAYGQSVSLRIRYQPDQGQYTVAITDYGRRLTPDEIDHFFDSLNRASTARSRSYSDAGVSLLLAHQWLVAQGGRVGIHSDEQFGNRFEIEMPAHVSIDRDDAEFSSRPDRPKLFSLPREGSSKRLRSTLLIATDSTTLLAEMDNSFRDTFDVLSSRSIRETAELARDVLPELILCDAQLADGSGQNLVETLLEQGLTRRSSVIFMSQPLREEERVYLRGLGVAHFLAKPFALEELELVLRNLNAIKTQQGEFKSVEDRFVGGTLISWGVDQADYAEARKIIEAVSAHIQDTQFTVENLAELNATGRVNLFRKCKAIFDRSPSSLISGVRLRYARLLLDENQGMRMSEIAFLSGHKSASHFSRRFKDEFGVTPSEFRDKGMSSEVGV